MIEDFIKEMEERIDRDDFEEVQEKCLYQIEKENVGISAVEPLLLFMERHPLSDFGMPGAIVHYVEQFYKKGYEDLLIASVTRRPTLHTVWMINRIKNAGENVDLYKGLFHQILEKQDVEEEIKNSVKEFLSK
ncbi:MAG: hypothetical protein K2N41_00670 [Lachnospiraceae bacterium]|nr:hypothetical protein [Lachnospiraceae bacterium]MDE7238209.1 hypothetical protein [Lachnospiraceae bacterium]